MWLSESAGLGNDTIVLIADISSRAGLPRTFLSVFCMSRNFLRIVNVRRGMMPRSSVLTPAKRVSAPRAYASCHDLALYQESWKEQADTRGV